MRRLSSRIFVLAAVVAPVFFGGAGVDVAVAVAHAAPAPSVVSDVSAEVQVLSMTLAQARKLPLGSKVTVRGTVSTPSGAFESSFGDKGFGLQDATAGIYVSFGTNVNTAPHDAARVTGILEDHSGLLTIVPATADDIRVHDDGCEIRPERHRTAEIGEATEGRIVRVSGTITEGPIDDLPYGFKFTVNDGSGNLLIFVNVQTGIDVGSLHTGQSVRVTGFSSQYADHYEIDPRRPSDIAISN